MPNLKFIPYKYTVILDCKKYKNSYALANKCNGFLHSRSNYNNINTNKGLIYYAFSTYAEVMNFYRNVTSMFPGITYSYTILKSERNVLLP